MDNDPILLEQVAAGDQAAFRQIYAHFFKRLYQFAFAMIKTRESAEEIVEDVFVRIWQRREEISSIRNLRVYLYTATKNAALNYLSRKARQNITEPFDHITIDLNGSNGTPEQLLITAETYRKIQTAIEALPPRCKMIFKLVREDGLKYREIAEILNISTNTIDVQMAIAVKRISLAIAAEFDFPLKRSSRQIGDN
ncbi:RNA polymerase sigma factor [Puia dinghuensis]|uniref:DNA-directed RNA polymerase sigma-70 factor n=1 Tax=Puia dinghuensis TaxID=1792502 RepID=A0A8J2UFV7_9BACT|nr:RNA polymerase sigma-70 factor [Puia dinghuensis]GGB12143.1 DNA-directed RNA polymerase sigma-70 factor [Puia dinghuensis]